MGKYKEKGKVKLIREKYCIKGMRERKDKSEEYNKKK